MRASAYQSIRNFIRGSGRLAGSFVLPCGVSSCGCISGSGKGDIFEGSRFSAYSRILCHSLVSVRSGRLTQSALFLLPGVCPNHDTFILPFPLLFAKTTDALMQELRGLV